MRTAAVVTLVLAFAAGTAQAGTNNQSVKDVIRRVFGPHARTAECIAAKESTGTLGHFNRMAVGRAGELGIFQLHPVHFGSMKRFGNILIRVDRERLFDPLFNAQVAYVMSRGGTSWGPWTTRHACGV